MDAITFVEKLRSIKLLIDENASFDQEFIDKYLRSYSFEAKHSREQFNDPIMDLVTSHDTSNVEIGMVTFLTKLRESDQFIYFGKFEADDLVINKSTKEIQLKEYNQAHKLCDCAKNSSSFLDALLSSAAFLAEMPLGSDLEDDQEANCNRANDCARLAGGEKYAIFYKMFLGCDE